MNKEAEDSAYGLADVKGLLPGILLASLAGGIGTGYMTHRTPERPGEDKEERRNRIIRNGVVGAAMAGGASGLGQMAFRNLSTAAPPMSEWWAGQLDPERKGGATNDILSGLAVGTVAAGYPTKSRGGSFRWRAHTNHAGRKLPNTVGTRLAGGGIAGLLAALLADPAMTAYYHIGKSTSQ